MFWIHNNIATFILKNSAVSSHLQDIEKLALLVGCLCHDLDHRGTNNMFQVEYENNSLIRHWKNRKTKNKLKLWRSHSALCQLYGTTGVLEKHHFNHCVMILNTAGHNIFSNIKPRTYGLLMSYIKEAILATDLAEHFMWVTHSLIIYTMVLLIFKSTTFQDHV
jgi:dual 3',5'-cyclic-AMP and -GMP phosphodiesterase 11